jgi:hypothetical protein
MKDWVNITIFFWITLLSFNLFPIRLICWKSYD